MNSADIWKFGYVVRNKKRMMPRVKSLKRIKREVRSRKCMDDAIDKLAYLIADAIIRRKYGTTSGWREMKKPLRKGIK